MGVLGSVLSHARQVSLDVTGILLRLIERRCEQLQQTRVVVYQMLLQRLHRQRTSVFLRTRDHAPTLRDRVDPALLARLRSQRCSVVEVRAAVPLAVPPVLLDGLGILICVFPKLSRYSMVPTSLHVN